MADDYECHHSFDFNLTRRAFTSSLVTPSMINSFAIVTFEESFSYEEICDAIEEALISVPLSEGEHQELIELAWNEACESVRTKPLRGYFVMDLDFQLLVHHQYISVLQNVEKSRGDSLKKNHETDSGSTSKGCCCICLEDLSDEGRAKMRLPCAHVFHEDCIKRWLRVSDRCPLCRSEIPTST